MEFSHELNEPELCSARSFEDLVFDGSSFEYHVSQAVFLCHKDVYTDSLSRELAKIYNLVKRGPQASFIRVRCAQLLINLQLPGLVLNIWYLIKKRGSFVTGTFMVHFRYITDLVFNVTDVFQNISNAGFFTEFGLMFVEIYKNTLNDHEFRGFIELFQIMIGVVAANPFLVSCWLERKGSFPLYDLCIHFCSSPPIIPPGVLLTLLEVLKHNDVFLSWLVANRDPIVTLDSTLPGSFSYFLHGVTQLCSAQYVSAVLDDYIVKELGFVHFDASLDKLGKLMHSSTEFHPLLELKLVGFVSLTAFSDSLKQLEPFKVLRFLQTVVYCKAFDLRSRILLAGDAEVRAGTDLLMSLLREMAFALQPTNVPALLDTYKISQRKDPQRSLNATGTLSHCLLSHLCNFFYCETESNCLVISILEGLLLDISLDFTYPLLDILDLLRQDYGQLQSQILNSSFLVDPLPEKLKEFSLCITRVESSVIKLNLELYERAIPQLYACCKLRHVAIQSTRSRV